MSSRRLTSTILSLAFGISLAWSGAASAQTQTPSEILNVSYDISRELFAEINPLFIAAWKAKTGQTIEVKQSHNGSSRQARAILEGLQADVVTFNQVIDVQTLADKGKLIAPDWQKKYANNSSPYYSLPSFLVRGGNRKKIKDWDDLVRNDVKLVFPNPKTSGNARYTYLAAYAYALDKFKGDETKAEEFVRTLLGNVAVFDTGGRAATTTFVEREIGDVLITFEAEVNGIKKEFGAKNLEIVTPSQSLLAEFPAAVVDKVVDQRGSRAIATAYIDFLYSDVGQEVLAKNYNRVRNPKVAAKYATQFPNVKLVTVEEKLGGWDAVQKKHFAEGGILDRVMLGK